jgi:hypothetical protein
VESSIFAFAIPDLVPGKARFRISPAQLIAVAIHRMRVLRARPARKRGRRAGIDGRLAFHRIRGGGKRGRHVGIDSGLAFHRIRASGKRGRHAGIDSRLAFHRIRGAGRG